MGHDAEVIQCDPMVGGRRYGPGYLPPAPVICSVGVGSCSTGAGEGLDQASSASALVAGEAATLGILLAVEGFRSRSQSAGRARQGRVGDDNAKPLYLCRVGAGSRAPVVCVGRALNEPACCEAGRTRPAADLLTSPPRNPADADPVPVPCVEA